LTAAAAGLVVAVHRRHARVHLDDGYDLDCVQKGRRLGLACGDRVRASVAAGGGVVESIEPRGSLFLRADAVRTQAIAANVDQVIGVVAPDIAVDEYLLNRWIVAAELQHCRFVLAANKADLPGFDALRARLAFYATLGYAVVDIAATRSIEPLLPFVAGRHSVLIGQSGMGKSTIVNALVPAAEARTGDISDALGAGRHTTTVARLYRLPAQDDAWIVDSPGIKVFGMAQADPAAIGEAFVELRPWLGRCRFRDCRHRGEPGCAVATAAADGHITAQRLALYHALVDEAGRGQEPAHRA
jgi:ribosome biogenesis GTPase / thiamine phosphate phosphatase